MFRLLGWLGAYAVLLCCTALAIICGLIGEFCDLIVSQPRALAAWQARANALMNYGNSWVAVYECEE